MEITKKILTKIKENIPLTILFIIATLFFIIQKATLPSWDFASFVLNAKYLFFGGEYFETIRPPLPSIFLALFLIIGKLGEYLYIIFVSGLFCYSSIKLSSLLSENSKDSKLNNFLFYALSLNVVTLFYGLKEGSELLALSFLYLTIYAMLNKKNSGIPLALAFLSKYNMVLFAPLMLINKSLKQILKNILLFIIIISPWLLFNYLKFGNAFTSIIDAYANNILLRDYLFTPMNIKDIILTLGTFFPFVIIGLILSISKLKNIKNKENLISILFILLAIFIVIDFSNIPKKEARYLFNLTLPTTFFAWKGIQFILSKIKFKIPIYTIGICIILLITINLSIYTLNEKYPNYKEATDKIKELNLTNCKLLSPHWVPIAYYLGNVHPLGVLSEEISQNKIAIIFPKETTIDDSFSKSELESSNKLFSSESLYIIGKENITSQTCAKRENYESTYVSNPCEIIKRRFNSNLLKNISNQICLAFNK